VTVAYAVSFIADNILHLGFQSFIISSAAVTILLFFVFVISFFAGNFEKYSKFIIYIVAVAILFHLIGLSVVNHFRPETLVAISSALFIAGFVFEIKILVLFDLLVCAMLAGAIQIDYYISEQFNAKHLPVVRPFIEPLTLMLIVAGVMVLTALITLIRIYISRKLITEKEKEPSPESFDEPVLIINAFSRTIIDCNEEAVNLFEAGNKNNLINILFESLLKETSADALNRLQRQQGVSILSDFISQKGKIFSGVIHAKQTLQQGIIQLTLFEIEKDKTRITETPSSFSTSPSLPFSDSPLLPVASIGLDYRFIKTSAAFCELTDFSQQELKNIKLPDLIHSDDKESVKQILSNLFSKRIPFNRSEKRLIKKSQQAIWVRISSTLQRDKNGFAQFVTLVMENISKQKRYERTLITDKTNLASVIDNSDSYIFAVDQNHTILFLSEKLKDVLFGLTDIVIETGFNLKQIIPPSYMVRYEEIFATGMKGEIFTTDLNVQTTSGSEVDMEISVHPFLDEANHVIRLIFSAKDISDRKQRERELIQEKTKAEASTEAKSSFLATMSHEIRTPLNGVIGMGRLLNQTELSPKQQDYLNSILLSGEALLTVINDILDYSKIESEKMELENKPFALKRCVEETFELLSAKSIEKNLSLQYGIQKDVPRYIIGDITRLRQVLLNLVSNAIKFTPQGMVHIHISRSPQSSVTDGSVELLFEVKDSGIGIPPEKIDRLFQSFSQAEASTAKTYGGTGLGLAISKNLVSLMGGIIWVKSNPGMGSSFFFTIKTRPAQTDEIPDGANGATRLAKAKLLLVSDNKEEANTYANYFKRWGMTVRTTDNTIIAIQWIKEKDSIDLVAIDAQMISAKALTVAEKLRGLATKEQLPIILINAGDDDITVEFTDKVLSAVVPKNIDRSKLLDILISVFTLEDHQRSRQEKELAATVGKRLGTEIPLRILIAEDNAINQKLVVNIFEGLGYKPDIASNGLIVIEKLKRNTYDIIFMDVQMPELDGLETTRFIINKMNLSRRPVIVAMTAFALEGDREKCIEAGMDDYISKPFMIEEIVQSIRKWGGGKQESRVKNQESRGESRAENQPSNTNSQILNLAALDRLKSLAAGNVGDFIKEIISMFLKQAAELIGEIKKAYSEKNYSEMSQHAHKLKGSALNLGATAMAELCLQIEVKGKNNEPADYSTLISEMKNIFALTRIELEKI